MLVGKQKNEFNPANPVHKFLARRFFESQEWGSPGCPFILEAPYEDIPTMMRDKLARHLIGAKQLEVPSEKEFHVNNVEELIA